MRKQPVDDELTKRAIEETISVRVKEAVSRGMIVVMPPATEVSTNIGQTIRVATSVPAYAANGVDFLFTAFADAVPGVTVTVFAESTDRTVHLTPNPANPEPFDFNDSTHPFGDYQDAFIVVDRAPSADSVMTITFSVGGTVIETDTIVSGPALGPFAAGPVVPRKLVLEKVKKKEAIIRWYVNKKPGQNEYLYFKYQFDNGDDASGCFDSPPLKEPVKTITGHFPLVDNETCKNKAVNIIASSKQEGGITVRLRIDLE